MKSSRDQKLRDHVHQTTKVFLTRAPVGESSLALSGTGVNGAIQYVVLDALGLPTLDALAHVDVVSGSAFAYLCFRAIATQKLSWTMASLPGWDKANRQWHGAGPTKVLAFLAKRPFKRAPLFNNADLAKILANTVTPDCARQKIGELPENVTIWLYDIDRKELAPVEARCSFADASVSDLVRCSSAVPALYGHGTLGGRRFIDPVYSPGNRELMSQLKRRTRNVLLSNMVMDRVTDQTIWLKPHRFGDGSRMILADFARFVMNVPNPRITTAFHNAFDLEAK